MSEYWIHENGSVTFADGSVGDQNHESIVMDILKRQIVEECYYEYMSDDVKYSKYRDPENVYMPEFYDDLAKAYAQRLIDNGVNEKKVNRILQNDPDNFTLRAFKKLGIKTLELSVAGGSTDARDYAMQKWKWKAYRDQHIDTWTFTNADLSAISTGIANIADEERWSEKQLNKISFKINVRASGKFFNLTYRQLTNPKVKSQGISGLQISQGVDPEAWGQASSTSMRNYEYDQLHPAYKRPGVNPFGDSNMNMDFKNFINESTP